MYQVCYDFIDAYNRIQTRVVYETDIEYEARCYIGEMYQLGDYSNYYIRVKEEESNNDNNRDI